MTKYKLTRERFWDNLIRILVIRLIDGAYIIKSDNFHKLKNMLLAKSTKHKSTGKDSGVRKDCTSAKHSRELATISTRPKPKKIEEIKPHIPMTISSSGIKYMFSPEDVKINEIIQVINYLLEK
jgi:hypothetical protein